MNHYAEYRMDQINRILSDGLTPIQVAKELRVARERFSVIDPEEILNLERMGDHWGGHRPLLEENEVASTYRTVQTTLSFPEPELLALPAPELEIPPAEG